MRTRDLFFSFKGRVSRQLWWLAFCTQLVASAAAGILLAIGLFLGLFLTGQIGLDTMPPAPGQTRFSAFFPFDFHPAAMIAWAVFLIVSLYSSLALATKRLRDADVSRTVLLLALPPFVLGLVLPLVIDPPQAAQSVVTVVGLLCHGLLTIILGFTRSWRAPA